MARPVFRGRSRMGLRLACRRISGRAVILVEQTCPSAGRQPTAPPAWGKKRVEVARDAAGDLTEDARQGGAAPGQDQRLHEQVISPARGERRCAGDRSLIANDRGSAADRAGSGSPPRSERRE